MAIIVKPNPAAGTFEDFVRVGLQVIDDSTGLPPTGVYIVYYTIDGSLPQIGGSTTTARRSPVATIPLMHSTTIKAFAQRTDAGVTTPIIVQYYNIASFDAQRTARTVSSDVTRYTMQVRNGDFVRTSRGQYGVVFGLDKVKQDIREVVLVEDVPNRAPIGNRTLPRFGSALNRLIGQAGISNDSTESVAGEIQTSLFQALTVLQALQTQSQVPGDEQIKDIVSIVVTPNSPTDYLYQIVVETLTGRQVSDTGTLKGN